MLCGISAYSASFVSELFDFERSSFRFSHVRFIVWKLTPSFVATFSFASGREKIVEDAIRLYQESIEKNRRRRAGR